MSYSRRSRRYSPSPSPPHKRYGRPVSRSRSSSRSRSYDSSDIENPGNNLYVTGLSPRITKRDLEKHFSAEGKVEDVHLVMDPWTRESRGFAFVSMSNIKEADRCIKYLDGSVLEGRVITVEKARRRRGRTPTPGRYLGLRRSGGGGRRRGRSPTYSPPYLSRSRSRRSCSSGYWSERSYSPYYSSRRRRRRSYTPYSRSPIRRSYTPNEDEDDYYSRRSYSYSPQYRRRKGYHYSPRYTTTRRRRRSSLSLSPSPSPSPSPRRMRRRYRGRSYSPSPSVSPVRSRRSYSTCNSRSRSPASAYSTWTRSASLASSRSSSPYT